MIGLCLTEACKGNQVHAVSPQSWLKVERGKCGSKFAEGNSETPRSSLASKLADPPIEPHFKPVDYVETLAEIHEELETAAKQEKAGLRLLQSFVFKGLGENKLLRRCLGAAMNLATTTHEKLVYAAWLQLEKKGEDLTDRSSSLNRFGKAFFRQAGDDSARNSHSSRNGRETEACSAIGSLDEVITFSIGSEEVLCGRQNIASLSVPFDAMLNGSFTESRMKHIDFSQNEISVEAMRAVDEFSRTDSLPNLDPDKILEVLAFANRFCCENMKDTCDSILSTLVQSRQDAVMYMEYGLEENAPMLVASCLEVLLQELPGSLQDPQVASLLSRVDTRIFMTRMHAAFALYSLLSQVAMEEGMGSDICVLLLECMRESAAPGRQKALALHQLGCVMLERKLHADAQQLFAAAAEEGHVYSLAGVARAKYYKGGQRHLASMVINAVVCKEKSTGWLHVEKSLYCNEKEKLAHLNVATELDPTLTYPYKYRAARLMDEQDVHAAIAEINRILGFKVTTDCLELRIYFCLACQDYAGAVRDVRALLTLNPKYTLYSGRVGAFQLLDLLSPHVDQWTVADCWMQLYDRWSSVDDIGSLAVVHEMLQSDSGNGLLFFRQSLLLLRLNCPKAAMRSLQLARQNASSEHERLVYEGWILYDTGHRKEALEKAENSINIERSFEAFFLKAYALADTSRDAESSADVVELLKDALKCQSDVLRKGQALNNLGSVYVDCGKLDLAADCYISALEIRHTRAHQGLARVFYLNNDRASAYDEMTKLVEKARNNASAYEKRSEYCERDRDKTMADLSMVTQLDPLRTYPYRYRAAVLMDSHREKEAIAELSKAVAFKADLHLLHLRAAFHEFVGDVNGALRDCRAALSVDPSHVETMELHGRVHSREP